MLILSILVNSDRRGEGIMKILKPGAYRAFKVIIEATNVNGQIVDVYKIEVEDMSHNEIKLVCQNIIKNIDAGATNPHGIKRTDLD